MGGLPSYGTVPCLVGGVLHSRRIPELFRVKAVPENEEQLGRGKSHAVLGSRHYLKVTWQASQLSPGRPLPAQVRASLLPPLIHSSNTYPTPPESQTLCSRVANTTSSSSLGIYTLSLDTEVITGRKALGRSLRSYHWGDGEWGGKEVVIKAPTPGLTHEEHK